MRKMEQIFYMIKSHDELNLLDSYKGLKKISDNLIIEPNDAIGIAEYGITNEVSLDALEDLTQEYPQAMIASCVF